jgi:DNA polymerase-4
MRIVLHADMDAFFASVEQRDDPSIRGKPVVVGGTSSRGVVSAASYEAREYGIHSAMPTVQARGLCPQAVFLRGDMAKYRRESSRIFEIFRRFTPVVEGVSLDEAFLDLTGTERLLGPVEEAVAKLRREVREETGLTVSVGVAPVKMVAKIASDMAKPDGVCVVPPDGVRDFLDPLPVGRIWGIGPKARERLEARGIRSIGDLARQSDAVLQEALGNWGSRAAQLARGEDTRDVEPYREAKSYGEENTFPQDVSDRATLRQTIRSHAEAVARRLRHDSVRGRGVRLKLKLARPLGEGRYPLVTRSLTLPVATDDGALIADAAEKLLERSGVEEPIRLLGVAVSRIESGLNEQLSLLPSPAENPRRRRLNRVIDDIQGRFGRDFLSRGGTDIERAGPSDGIKPGEITGQKKDEN